MEHETDEFEFENTWPRGGSPEELAAAARPDSKAYEIWWAVRYHLGSTFVGTPIFFFTAVKDGTRAFRREFGDTFGQRWKNSDRKEAYRRFTNV